MCTRIWRLMFVAIMIFISFGLAAKGYTIDQVPNVQKTDRTKYVVDPDGVMSTAARSRVDSLLGNIRQVTTAEVAFVIIGNMEPKGHIDIDTYATELFEKWGIGDKDKDTGVLLLVSMDDRKFSLRTGYGVEGVLPDMICRDITENNLVPAMKSGDYDRGFVAVAQRLHKTMTDEKYRGELMADIKKREAEAWTDLLNFVLLSAVVLTSILVLFLIYKLYQIRSLSPYEKYLGMQSYKYLFLICCFIGIGLPLLVYLPYIYLMNKWRNGEHNCPNCSTSMNKLDEVSDNKYLTPAQDAEERFESVDYDVWLCPSCGETDVYPYVNKNSALTICPMCHTRTLRQLQDRIVVQPTEHNQGKGVREYVCLNCGKRHGVPYNIAKLASPGIIILPGGFGGGRGSGGSFGGGFSGGSTGGGGYSGGW